MPSYNHSQRPLFQILQFLKTLYWLKSKIWQGQCMVDWVYRGETKGVFPLKNVSSILHQDLGLTLNCVPTSTIILGRTHFSSNVGSSLLTRMSVYKYIGICGVEPTPNLRSHSHFTIWYHVHMSILPAWNSFEPGSSPLIRIPTMKNMWARPRVELWVGTGP